MKLYKDTFNRFSAIEIQFDVFDDGEEPCQICFDFGKKKNGHCLLLILDLLFPSKKRKWPPAETEA